MKLAERGGFEPPVGFKPTHAFQACALNHSAISPASRLTLKQVPKGRNIFQLAQSAFDPDDPALKRAG